MLDAITEARPGRDAGDLPMMEDLQGMKEQETEINIRKDRRRLEKNASCAFRKITKLKVRHSKRNVAPLFVYVCRCEKHINREKQNDKGCMTE